MDTEQVVKACKDCKYCETKTSVPKCFHPNAAEELTPDYLTGNPRYYHTYASTCRRFSKYCGMSAKWFEFKPVKKGMVQRVIAFFS